MLSLNNRSLFILNKALPLVWSYTGVGIDKIVQKHFTTKGGFRKTSHSFGRNLGHKQTVINHIYYILIDLARKAFRNKWFLTLKLLASRKTFRTALLKLACTGMSVCNVTLRTTKDFVGGLFRNLTKKPKNFGDSSRISRFTSGSLVHNVNNIATAAGTFLVLVRKGINYCLTRLRSGTYQFIANKTVASLGVVGNENHFLRKKKKAGNSRRLGKRPHTRASAKNPVDHPMGGRTKGGSQPMTKKGKITINIPTKKRRSSLCFLTRREVKYKTKRSKI